MPRTRPPYPPEFRREAIKLVRVSSKSQHQIAEDLGISDVTLRNWVKQAERDEGKRPDGLSSDEREELARPAVAPLVTQAWLGESFHRDGMDREATPGVHQVAVSARRSRRSVVRAGRDVGSLSAKVAGKARACGCT